MTWANELLERRAIISGIGLSEVGRHLGRPSLDLAVDASLSAIADAGLTVGDIDGMATMGDAPTIEVKEALGAEMSWIGTSGKEGSGGHLRFVVDACMAVATGLCNHVLIYRSVSMLSGELPSAAGEWAWHLPFYEFTASSIVARYARRHMFDYGTTRDQMAQIALVARGHASLNEKAVMRSPLTMDQYLASRWIAEPLCLYDCDLPVDGAVAFIISRAEHAAGCPSPPVRFEALGCAIRGQMSWEHRDAYPMMGATDAAAQMWSRTDLVPSDVDVAELYDGFSFLTMAWLEALGFCETGESGPFVEGGQRITLGGELPLNTYGGQLSAGRIHGYWVLHEAVVQLRHQAGERQVVGADVAVVSAGGGHRTGCLLLTR